MTAKTNKRPQPIIQPNKEIHVNGEEELTMTFNGNELNLILTAIQKSLTMEYGLPLTKKIEAQIVAQKS